MSQDWSPLDPETLDNPHETYANLRGKCPVPHTDQWDGFWSLLKHEDIAKASVDGRTYISSVQNVIPMVGMGKRIPLHVDPPIHTFYRRVLNPPFQPDNIARHEESIRAMAVELLETLLEAGEGDFIEGFTYHLPMRALCEFLNIPQQDATEIKDRSERYAHALETGDRDALRAESDALYEYARQQVAHRKQNLLNPYQDVLSALLTARHEDNQPIDDEIIVGCLRQLIVAGNLTLTLSIASAVLHLAKDAALQNELRQNPHRIPAAIEEFLRLYPPNQAFARTTTREVEISGQKIPEGDVIAFVWIAANRDPEVFPNPDEFDMERERNPHLSFGHGIHKCLGIALARLEMRIALEELLARTSHFELTAPAELVNKWPEYGPQCLPLRFERLANEAE